MIKTILLFIVKKNKFNFKIESVLFLFISMELTHCQFCLNKAIMGPESNICEFCHKLALCTIKYKRMRNIRVNDRGEICTVCVKFCRKEFMTKKRSYCIACRMVKEETYRNNYNKKRRTEKTSRNKVYIPSPTQVIPISPETNSEQTEQPSPGETNYSQQTEQNWDIFTKEVAELYETIYCRQFQQTEQYEQFGGWASQIIS
ncbi:hypothetical protein PV-S19_0077 [Pacmanvirus S19]|nr:hypothetical protein PV-S19_0077 [Pacmanvirus S19]